MRVSGFSNAPITRLLLLTIVLTSLLASLSDKKHFFPIHITPHIYPWGQYWRIFTWQLAYQNSVEVLCAAITVYEMRVLERLWGSKKFLAFLVVTYVYVAVIVPAVVGLLFKPLSFGAYQYVPSGQTALLFALLANWKDAVPATYRYRIGLSDGPLNLASLTRHTDSNTSTEAGSSTSSGLTVTMTSKSSSYFLPLQLTISQFPYSVLPAAIGWAIGLLLRNEVIPGIHWRVPFYGSESKKSNLGVEALRWRIETDGIATASGVERRDGTSGGMVNQQLAGRTRVDT